MKELLKNKKLVGAYILWVTIQIFLLIISWGTMSRYAKDDAREYFWPFTDMPLTRAYDITEFAVYCIIPLGLIISINYLFPKKDESK